MTSADTPAIEHKPESSRAEAWKRGLFMIAFLILFGFGQSLMFAAALIQFFWLLLAGERNALLQRFGASLAVWFGDVARYLTCASETKPFPWSEWPRVT